MKNILGDYASRPHERCEDCGKLGGALCVSCFIKRGDRLQALASELTSLPEGAYERTAEICAAMRRIAIPGELEGWRPWNA